MQPSANSAGRKVMDFCQNLDAEFHSLAISRWNSDARSGAMHCTFHLVGVVSFGYPSTL